MRFKKKNSLTVKYSAGDKKAFADAGAFFSA
jgi:hypothetical protein